MKLQDALFNWVQIQMVADARPEDRAAQSTVEFFATVLQEDHHVSACHIEQIDQTMVHIRYAVNGSTKKQMIPRESAEQLLQDINSNPKYNE